MLCERLLKSLGETVEQQPTEDTDGWIKLQKKTYETWNQRTDVRTRMMRQIQLNYQQFGPLAEQLTELTSKQQQQLAAVSSYSGEKLLPIYLEYEFDVLQL